MRTSIRRLTHFTLGAILCGSLSSAATFQLVGSDPTPIPITGPTFVFNPNIAGGGAFEFSNQTGGVLTSLTFLADIPRGPGGCSAPQFSITSFSIGIANTGNYYDITSDCSLIPQPAPPFDHFALYIFGTDVPQNTGPGIGVFTVILNDDKSVDTDGSGGWGGATFQGSATSSVPEPATYVLMGAGLAGLAILRRRCS